jgi:hypothetical protein
MMDDGDQYFEKKMSSTTQKWSCKAMNIQLAIICFWFVLYTNGVETKAYESL